MQKGIDSMLRFLVFIIAEETAAIQSGSQVLASTLHAHGYYLSRRYGVKIPPEMMIHQ